MQGRETKLEDLKYTHTLKYHYNARDSDFCEQTAGSGNHEDLPDQGEAELWV